MAFSYDQAKALLAKHGQDHVFKFWDKLNESEKSGLLAQIESLDFPSIERMKKALANRNAAAAKASSISPPPVIALKGGPAAKALKCGEDALRAGQAGVILVAGGQGSRLGFEGPKGCYNLAPVSNASLFEIHSRKILALERKYAAKIPFYIMTSDVNDRETREFFAKNSFFGLSADGVKFFVQGMWPALWEDGRIILEDRGRIFMSPDGHGGVLRALLENKIFDDMKKRGLTTLFYFQVDNPLVEIADPSFIGVHLLNKADISIKVCAKRDPEEGVGVVVIRDGRDAIVEYTELTKEQKHERLPDGKLKIGFGSVGIHVFSLAFLEKEARTNMPIHLAHKKVAYCDDNGNTIKPDKPNACKFEKFIFDVVPDAVRAVNLEFAREDEFSPMKNKEGNDSPDMSRRDMIRKFARWFKQCGIDVPMGENHEPRYNMEIDPCYANCPEDLKKRIGPNFRITGDLLLRD